MVDYNTGVTYSLEELTSGLTNCIPFFSKTTLPHCHMCLHCYMFAD